MNSTATPFESHSETKSTNDTNHKGPAVTEKFRDDIKHGTSDTSKMRAPSTAMLHDLEIFDATVAGATAGGVAFGVAKDVIHTAENEWSNLKAGVNGVEKIAPQTLKGAVDEVEQHPLQVASDALFGAGVAMGVAALAPEAVVGLGLVAGAYAGYKIMSKAEDWAQDARVDCNPSEFSQKDIDAANTDLQNTGASAARALAAGIGGAGGFAYMSATDAAASEGLRSVTAEFSHPVDQSIPGVAGYITSGLQHAMDEPEARAKGKYSERSNA